MHQTKNISRLSQNILIKKVWNNTSCQALDTFPDLNSLKNKEITVDMIVHWMRVGFVHGVMNTDMTLQKRKKTCKWIHTYQKCIRKHAISEKDRREKMNQVNPKYILRNYLAQLAIDKVEEGDFSMVHELLDVLRKPYDEQPDQKKYYQKRPDWARDKPGCAMLSCSS